MATSDNETLVKIDDLKVQFQLREGVVRAIDGVGFEIKRSQTLGVVGESGCGKSMTARALMRIIPYPGKITAGHLYYNRLDADGNTTETLDLAQLDPKGKKIRTIRGAEIAMVFQEPMTSLSPVHTIGDQIMEAILLHQSVNKATAREQTIDVLRLVGMPKAEQNVDSYPHQLSGGMRQRAMIAMALSCRPTLLIADEPTTALDVTTEAQILDLMRELQEQLGMAIMYITHNLGVIAEMTEYVVVMYLGKIVEATDVDSLFFNPKHPYTRALLNSMPRLGQKSNKRLESIKGMVPDPYSIPKGCSFHPRCTECIAGLCDQQDPPLIQISERHVVKCHLYGAEG